MVAQNDACGGQRRPRLAHIFAENLLGFVVVVVVIGAGGGAHVPHLCVVGVLSFADGTDGFQADGTRNGHGKSPFHAVEGLVDACHRHV